MEFLAQEKLQQLKAQATTQIKDLFIDNKKIEISIEIPSSKILYPRFTNIISSPLLVIDTGSISFQRVFNINYLSFGSIIDENLFSFYQHYLLNIRNANAFLSSIDHYQNRSFIVLFFFFLLFINLLFIYFKLFYIFFINYSLYY